MPQEGPVPGPPPPALRAELVEFLAALVRTVRRSLADRPNRHRCPIADRAEAERRQLEHALDNVEQSRTDLFRALARVRACLQHHAGDDPAWRTGQEHTPLGQADVVAEGALEGALAEGVDVAPTPSGHASSPRPGAGAS
jgi:hypothetical protein